MGAVKEQTTNTYNVQGRLQTVEIDEDVDTNPGTDTTTEYKYNDEGMRISQTVNGTKTLYMLDGNNPTGYQQILEESASATGNLLRSYVLGLNVISQWLADDGTSNSALHYLLYDGHGSTRGLVDATGQPLTGQIYAYDAFGNRLDSSNALTTLLYSGEQTEAVTGLQYLRARYYDPTTGRFNRLDPFAGNIFDPFSLHKYVYTHNDPVDGVDPSGLIRSLFGEADFGLEADRVIRKIHQADFRGHDTARSGRATKIGRRTTCRLDRISLLRETRPPRTKHSRGMERLSP